MTFKDIIRQVTPPVFIHLAQRMRRDRPMDTYGLSGDYHTWDEALAVSTGYDSAIILEKTRIALLKVKKGEAAYERDSVLFDEIQYSWPLLAGLMWVAARLEGRLNVLDFGGSLGSTYYQNRAFLSALPHVRWNIVEQSRHVETGRALFEDDTLHFYAGITDCLADTLPNAGLLSGVLQYLEHPYTILDQMLELPGECVIIDRTPFWTGPTDRLCLQTEPPGIFPVSYPSWMFSKSHFLDHLHRKDWKMVAMFDGLDRPPGPVELVYQGMILARSSSLS